MLPGCLTEKACLCLKKTAGIDEEELMLLVLEAGAEDFSSEENKLEIIAQPEEFDKVSEALESSKVKILSANITMLPQTTVELNQEDAAKMLKLLEALEEHDDVQEVYTNFDIPADMVE